MESRVFYSIPNNLTNYINDELYEFTSRIRTLKTENLKIYHIDHHLAHAANAFNMSGYSKAAIITPMVGEKIQANC